MTISFPHRENFIEKIKQLQKRKIFLCSRQSKRKFKLCLKGEEKLKLPLLRRENSVKEEIFINYELSKQKEDTRFADERAPSVEEKTTFVL